MIYDQHRLYVVRRPLHRRPVRIGAVLRTGIQCLYHVGSFRCSQQSVGLKTASNQCRKMVFTGLYFISASPRRVAAQRPRLLASATDVAHLPGHQHTIVQWRDGAGRKQTRRKKTKTMDAKHSLAKVDRVRRACFKSVDSSTPLVIVDSSRFHRLRSLIHRISSSCPLILSSHLVLSPHPLVSSSRLVSSLFLLFPLLLSDVSRP